MKHYPEALFINNGQSLELLRLTYKSVGVFAYIPSALVEKLGLEKDRDHCLLAVFDDGLIVLTKERRLIEELRPKILEAREWHQKLKSKRL